MDVDVGIDDALALMLAVRSPELKIRAVTTVSGNVHVDKVTINALKVLEAMGVSNIPVAKGIAKPLLRDLEVAEDFHGKDGLGDSNIALPKLYADKRHAVDVLIQEALANPKQITVVATGPLTNVATAILRDPGFAENVHELVVMGGAYGVTVNGYGNANPVAEYNIYTDPEAASIVFKSGINLTAVGLDVTQNPETMLTKELHARIEDAGTASAKLAALITRNIMSRYGFFHLHDPTALAIVADRSLASIKKYHVEIETTGDLTRGQTVTDRRDWLPESYRKPPNTNVCVSVDAERFRQMFISRIIGS
jgi:inosine-uridine nucleoside N-ribohydrolase